jgi:hypothetical protein
MDGVATKFKDAAHNFCQRIVQGMRGIDQAAMIIKFLEARFPAQPFFPGSDLKCRNSPFTSLKAAFLYFRWALAMHYQHRDAELVRQRHAFFVGLAVGKRRIGHDAEAEAELLFGKREHEFIRKTPDAVDIAENIDSLLADDISINQERVERGGNGTSDSAFSCTGISPHRDKDACILYNGGLYA